MRREAPSGELEAVRVRTLGSFGVVVGARPIAEDGWRLKKAASLVKLLAIEPGHRMHRDRIMAHLWPDLGEKAARNNLRHALHVARRTLEPSPTASRYLSLLPDERLALCPDSQLWVDVEAFEESAKTARYVGEPAAYRAALDLYSGALLPDDPYEAWVENRREELRGTYLTLLVELAGLYEEREKYAPAVEALRRAITEEPSHEEAHAGLMQLYARSGRQTEALAQYDRLDEVLAREFAVEPNAATRRLREEILTGKLAPARVPETGRLMEEPPDTFGHVHRHDEQHNLPIQRSSFVGRERELVEVRRELAMTRLLTVTGAGGSGKTRLAVEAAQDLVGAYPDGVWLIEFAPLSEGELVPQTMASALGVREQPGRSIADTLIEHLRKWNALLVMDNCEHVAEAGARLVDDLLSSCPALRILATSREALRTGGEVVWHMPSLSVPGPEGAASAEELLRSEAARLFLERARARHPDFELTDENAVAIAEICDRLDGMPLAIELAAARVGVLSPKQMAKRLDDSLGLLRGGSRTATPRQQTLRGTLDWGHELLSESEKKLFRRLSVFAGGWTLEAAEAVDTEPEMEPGAEDGVLELLESLADKSLVIAEGTSPVRYRLLEPVRQYAREKLEYAAETAAPPGEAKAVRRRHAAYFLALEKEAGPGLRGARQEEWLEHLRREHDNLRTALEWSLEPAADEESGERAEPGLRLATALGRFWNVYGMSEGREWLEKGLAKSGTSPALVRAKALYEAGWMAMFQGDGRAIAMLEECLVLFRELGDASGTAIALTNLGFALIHGGDEERVATLSKEAEVLRREPVDRRALAHLSHFLALAALDARDHERAMALSEESLALYRELGDVYAIVVSLTALGMISLGAGDPDRAATFFEENLHLLSRKLAHDKTSVAHCLLGLASVAGSQGRPARAARLWGAAEALREANGMRLLSPFARSQDDYERRLSAACSLLDDEEAWDSAWSEGRAMAPDRAIEYALAHEPAYEPAPSASEDASSQVWPSSLTRREEEIAVLVARGLSNRRVAGELAISERTVETHVGKILKKLGLRSRVQMSGWTTERRSHQAD